MVEKSETKKKTRNGDDKKEGGRRKGEEKGVVTRCHAPVVQKVDNTVHQINLYPLNNAIGFPNTYPLDSNNYLSSG